jgi:sugar O-acyltransferase (sialic acid O-acetyltransferase NeuD family)
MYILGAGALGEIALETARRAGLKVDGFYDDIYKASDFNGVPLLGRFEDFRKNAASLNKSVFVAIGNNQSRRICIEGLRETGAQLCNIIDPSAVISLSATLGYGNLILPNAYVGTKCTLGSSNLIFAGVSISHHNLVGSYCFFSPNASIGGFTSLGDECKIGMNSVVLPYLDLGSFYESEPLTLIRGAIS